MKPRKKICKKPKVPKEHAMEPIEAEDLIEPVREGTPEKVRFVLYRNLEKRPSVQIVTISIF